MPPALEEALRSSIPEGERIIWTGKPSITHAVELQSKSRWQRVAILGGGYSVVGACVALWLTGDLRWLALPIAALGICAAGLWSEHRRSARVANVLAHTAYALTTRHAVVVQTQPSVQKRTIALTGVEQVSIPSVRPGLGDIIFQAEDGQHLVFSDIEDPASVEELIDGVKATPEAFERQADLFAQWAEIAKQFG
jgi:hypothetical protein